MPRARNLKPSFFKDEELVECGPLAMLLFSGLWCLADREGRLEDRPKLIKAEIFPYTEVSVEAYLKVLDEKGFITRYEVEAKKFIEVRNFKKHQHPHVKELPSTIPAPGQHQTGTVPNPEIPVPAPNQHRAEPGNSGASTSCIFNPLTLTLNLEPQPAAAAPVDSLVSEIAKEMRAKHRKTTGLGGLELERELCTLSGDAIDPPAVLRAIRDRWRLGCEREWARSDTMYWPNLLDWLRRRRYLDPAPPEPVATLDRPRKSALEALIDSV